MDPNVVNNVENLKKELQGIINELNSISYSVRTEFEGVGNNICAERLSYLAACYSGVLNMLSNVNYDSLSEEFKAKLAAQQAEIARQQAAAAQAAAQAAAARASANAQAAAQAKAKEEQRIKEEQKKKEEEKKKQATQSSTSSSKSLWNSVLGFFGIK